MSKLDKWLLVRIPLCLIALTYFLGRLGGARGFGPLAFGFVVGIAWVLFVILILWLVSKLG